MKKIFFPIFVLSFFFADGQVLQQNNSYGWQWKSLMADSAFVPPIRDTLSWYWNVSIPAARRIGSLTTRPQDSLTYRYNGLHWEKLGSGSGTYTASNGITLSGNTFKLGGNLTENTNIDCYMNQFNIVNSNSLNLTSNSEFYIYGQDIMRVEGFYETTIGSSTETNIYSGSQLNMIAPYMKIDIPSKGVGKVLTSDAFGNATWATPSGGGGDSSIHKYNLALTSDRTLNGNRKDLYLGSGLDSMGNLDTFSVNSNHGFSINDGEGGTIKTDGKNMYVTGLGHVQVSGVDSVSVNSNKIRVNANDSLILKSTNTLDIASDIIKIKSDGAMFLETVSDDINITPNSGSSLYLNNLTASSDTTTVKPLGINSGGKVFKMNNWPSHGGGGGGGGGGGSADSATFQTNFRTDTMRTRLNNATPFFNVRAYGAVGDSTTDDRAAIKAAYNAMPARGGTLYFPAGRYRISDSIIIDKPITILGDGMTTGYNDSAYLIVGTQIPTVRISEIIAVSATKPALELRKPVIIEKIGFDYTGSTPSAGNTALLFTKSHGMKLEKISVANFYDGIHVQQKTAEYTIHACGIYGAYRYGLWTENTDIVDYADQNITDCHISPYRRNAIAAIYLTSGGGIKVVNTKINGTINGVGDMKKFLYGIHVNNSTSVTAVLLLANNSIENITTNGIRLEGSSNWVNFAITGNQIAYYGTPLSEGIYIGNNFYNGAVTGNSISCDVSTTVNGIRSPDPATNFVTIASNMIRDFRSVVNAFDLDIRSRSVLNGTVGMRVRNTETTGAASVDATGDNGNAIRIFQGSATFLSTLPEYVRLTNNSAVLGTRDLTLAASSTLGNGGTGRIFIHPTGTDTTSEIARFTGLGMSVGSKLNPNASAIVDITSTDKGFLTPRMTRTQADAIASKATALKVYSTTDSCELSWNGTKWMYGFKSGYYTPTLTNTANIDASTAYACIYSVSGDMVTVSGTVDIDPSSASVATELRMTLPIATTFTNTLQGNGTATPTLIQASWGIESVNGASTVAFKCSSNDVSNLQYKFTFTYKLQ